MAERFEDDGRLGAAARAELPVRILHIEDDLALADMYALGLEMQGFEILKASDGVAGVEAASTSDPDFVVIDIDLPLLDGLQVLALLRQDPRTAALPAVLLSGCNPSDYRQRAAQLGVEEVLLKSETTPRMLGESIHRRLVQLREFSVGTSPRPPAPESPLLTRVTRMEDTVKVLVIEDDPAVAEMYRLRLVSDGYEVVVGCNGEEGLRLAVDEAPDFIYLDLRLPKLDGFEVLKRLRGMPATAGIPVIILSNYGDPELRERGLKLGALEFLVKADTTPSQLTLTVGRITGAQPAALD